MPRILVILSKPSEEDLGLVKNCMTAYGMKEYELSTYPQHDFRERLGEVDIAVAFGTLGPQVVEYKNEKGFCCHVVELPPVAQVHKKSANATARKEVADKLTELHKFINTKPRPTLHLTAALSGKCLKITEDEQEDAHLTFTEIKLIRDAMEVLGVRKINITINGDKQEKGDK